MIYLMIFPFQDADVVYTSNNALKMKKKKLQPKVNLYFPLILLKKTMAFYLFILTGNGCCCSGIYQTRSFERCLKKEDIYCQSNHIFSFLFIHLFKFILFKLGGCCCYGTIGEHESIQ